jgi:transcription antitermination factor NusG
MKNDDDIQDIIKQLNVLHIKQNELLARLERATESEVDETRSFELGDTVKVKNPGPFQPTKGRITRIGKNRITVTAQSGAKIVRAPKNLVLE